MKVIFSIEVLGTGGAERVATVLSNRFIQEGHAATIVCFYIMPDFNYYVDPRVQIVEFESNRKMDKGLAHWLYVTKRIIKLHKFLKEFKPDVMISFYVNNSCQNLLSAFGTGVPVVISERDAFVTSDGQFKRLLRRLFYPWAKGFIYQTYEAKKALNKYNTKNKPSLILANPVHIDAFYDEVEVGSYKKIVCAGRLDQNKNFAGIIQAFSQVAEKHPEFTLEIYGDGPERLNLSNLIENLGLQEKVKLAGITTDIVHAFTGASLFVLFSDTEGFPNVLLEAMAVGLPVISSDCPIGGPALLIKDGVNGLLVAPGDIDALAQKMDYLLSDKDSREKFAANARCVRTKNNITRIYKDLENFILSI